MANHHLKSASVPAIALLLLALAGCVSLPSGPAVSPTFSLPPALDSVLARAAIAAQPSPDSSGIRLLPAGPEAFEARRTLAQSARSSLDLQYFMLRADGSGRELLRDLRDAALRGVRVRLLLDDLYAPSDDLLLGLASFPNVDVRLFNPLPLRGAGVAARYAASLLDFERLNHRMHNKLFLADAVVAITGGRNLADEYFSRRNRSNFVDLDVLATGAVIATMQQQFDDYWNSPLSLPIQRVARVSPLAADELRERFDASVADAITPETPGQPHDFLGQPLLADDLRSGTLHVAWGDVESFADPAAKPLKQLNDAQNGLYGLSVLWPSVLEVMRSARSEVVLTSPYFIPGPKGVEFFQDLTSRGIKVKILTNSLASTDQPLVHGAYRRYRQALLEAGVELYELSPTRVGSEKRRKTFGVSAGGLHTKSLVIDREIAVIGSKNFDPRSNHFNTESALLIRVPQIGKDAAQLARISALEGAHRVTLAEDGSLRWADPVSSTESHEEEPETSIWSRSWLRVLSLFAPESLL